MAQEISAEVYRLLDRLETEAERIERAIQFSFSGSAEHGSFLRGTSTEYVPCAFETVNELKRAVVELRKKLMPPKVGESVGLSEALIIVPSKR